MPGPHSAPGGLTERRPGAGEHVGTLPRLPFLSGSLSCFSALAALSSVDTRGQYMLILEGRVWRRFVCFFLSALLWVTEMTWRLGSPCYSSKAAKGVCAPYGVGEGTDPERWRGVPCLGLRARKSSPQSGDWSLHRLSQGGCADPEAFLGRVVERRGEQDGASWSSSKASVVLPLLRKFSV